MIEIGLWGVMGSMPGANRHMIGYGSNTSCISMTHQDTVVFFDAGTGLAHSSEITANCDTVHLFLTHYHYDHIMGFPFWPFLYQGKNTVHIYGPCLGDFNLEGVLSDFFSRPYLPMSLDQVPAKLIFHTVKAGQDIAIDGLLISTLATSHPGGNLAYSLTDGVYKAVYLTDLDYDDTDCVQLQAFCLDAHFLYMDVHFTPQEHKQARYSGWGHSTIEHAIALKTGANVLQVFLGHHAPHRRAHELDALLLTYGQAGLTFAKENTKISLGPHLLSASKGQGRLHFRMESGLLCALLSLLIQPIFVALVMALLWFSIDNLAWADTLPLAPLAYDVEYEEELTDYLNKQKQLALDINHFEGAQKVDALNQLFEIYFDRNRIEADDYAQEALVLASEMGYQEGRLQALLNQAYAQIDDEQYALAITSLEAISIEIEQSKQAVLVGKLKNAYGMVWLALSDYSRAQDAFDDALSVYQTAQYRRGIAQVKQNLGIVYEASGGYDKAMAYYLEALGVFEEDHYFDEAADVLANVGSVQAIMGKQDDALDYYARALGLYERLENQKAQAVITGHLGLYFSQSGLYDQANALNQEALSTYQALGDQSGEADMELQIGQLFFLQGQIELAIDHYQRAQLIYESIQSVTGSIVCQNNLGTAYYAMGNYEEALVNHLGALNQSQDITYKEGLLSALKNLSQDYAALNQLEKSNEMLATYVELNDYLIQQSMQEASQSKQVLYETQKKEEALKAEQAAKAVLDQQRRNLIVVIVAVALVSCIIFALLVLVAKERSKSEKLLLNILPRKIARDLKRTGKTTPERFNQVTVYFSDIVNFTTASSTLDPEFLIEELNGLFTMFDEVMEKHGCERIKTIGDAYMAVCGMPVAFEDHGTRMINAAIELRDRLLARNSASDTQWHIRIGIHSGSVVGGIVGVKKYIYDVFGDTINTASRMESNSEPMRINVSEATHAICQQDYAFEQRDLAQIKGKGQMQMYFVEPLAQST